ncbi:hypothetical protein B0H14DRAFT_3537965 [Mycena olivaceomarginata]|nr:hypothetical protein B0H14DRAFT_3537965 [Mycena olivaceomarginata]
MRRLDNLYGVKSPTPEIETVRERFAGEEHEDNELELVIRLSLAHPQPTSQQAGPSRLRLPSPIQQAGRLRSLSASPELPAALFPTLNSFSSSPSPSPPPALGRARAPDVTAQAAATPPMPRKRRPAASVQKGTYTTGGRNPGDLPHCTHVSRRPFADPRRTNRFTSVFVDEALKPPTAICIDSCPQWPDYVFDDPTLARLGIDTELYSTIHGTFIGINKEPALDHIISTFFPSTRSLHLRYNVSGERAAVRAAYKQQDATPIIVVDDDSDSEVEVTSGKRPIKREPGVSPPRQRPCLSINTSLSRLSAPASSATPSLSATPSSSSTLSISSTPATTPLLSPKTWPRRLYVSDTAPGFAIMQSHKHLSHPEQFHLASGGEFKYVQGTWNENAAYWYTYSTPQQREDAIAAGRTAAGLWSEFRRRVNAARGQ